MTNHSINNKGEYNFALLLRRLLFPFSLIYGFVIRVRNFCFDKGWIPSTSYEVPIISLGNITVGGTGKTPHAEYLIRLLQPFYQITLISRGYRRKTKGVVVATSASTASDIGDEPMQMFAKHQGLNVVVAEKRVLGIEAAMNVESVPDVIVMDDAYQHRYVKPGFSILLMDISRPLWKDCMIPAGDLREPLRGKRRADVILVTKCPSDLTETEALIIEKRLKPSYNQQVYFTSFEYGSPYPMRNNSNRLPRQGKIIVLTGIARPQPLYQYLQKMGYDVIPKAFPDHHDFSKNDLLSLANLIEDNTHKIVSIFTTEKDAVRLKELENVPDKISRNIWVIPIEPVFLFGKQEKFNHQILEYVRKNQQHV